jgi:hypothetical protein
MMMVAPIASEQMVEVYIQCNAGIPARVSYNSPLPNGYQGVRVGFGINIPMQPDTCLKSYWQMRPLRSFVKIAHKVSAQNTLIRPAQQGMGKIIHSSAHFSVAKSICERYKFSFILHAIFTIPIFYTTLCEIDDE